MNCLPEHGTVPPSSSDYGSISAIQGLADDTGSIDSWADAIVIGSSPRAGPDERSTHGTTEAVLIRDECRTEVRKRKGKEPLFARVFLTSGQQLVRKVVVERRESVFFTGAAGTGKSLLLQHIVQDLQDKLYREAVDDRKPAKIIGVTATTGLAATRIGGMTVQAFLGFFPNDEYKAVKELVKGLRGRKLIRDRWRNLSVLIIDEISMLSGKLLDKIDEVAREMKKTAEPFGGIQVVFTGDFLQLPPIMSRGERTVFAFEAKCWAGVIDRCFMLTVVRRQNDSHFVDALERLRQGSPSDEDWHFWNGLSRKLPDRPGIVPTRL